jgi:hypothetical protein
VFKRIRDDKEANEHDIRYAQIEQIVYIEKTTSSADLPKSEIIAREVYSKQSKGKTNVLKFIAWKTNKSELDSRFPEYVLQYTNFSPTRKEPLKKEIRISNDKKQILELMDALKTKNVKKGWVLVEE